MSFPLSSLSTSAFITVFESDDLEFINDKREVTYDELSYTTASVDLSYAEFTQYVRNLNFKDTYFTFLTDYTNLSSYITTAKSIAASAYGFDMHEFNTKYDWIINNFTQSVTAVNDTQFLGVVDYNANFNILPLKTKTSINGEQYSIDENYREYQRIYDLADNVYLQFKVDKIPFELKPDKYSILFNSYEVASCYINDAEFIKNGALGGNCPLNSDVIFFELNEYGSYTNNGPENVNTVNNGTLLCLWLSSQSVAPSSDKIWMERWYDPNTVTQGQAFISQKNTLSSSFSYIVDIPSQKILSEKEKLSYLRYGPERNETFINNLSANLQISFQNWDQNFSSEVNNISGFIIGNYPKATDTFVSDGTPHGHVPPEDALFIQNDLTLSLWANASDWKSNNDSQFFGNYHDETGYGIFYNTGTSNNLISIPTSADNLFALNNRGFKVFEKDMKNDLGLSAIAINYIKTDLFGNRWIYDSHNQSLYKIENDDLVIKTVNLPVSADITKIECDSNNRVYVFDNAAHKLSAFQSNGNYISSYTVSAYYDNFDIDINDNVVLEIAEFLTVTSENTIVKMVGPTLYIDGERVLHLPGKAQSMRLDLDDNIWILYQNRVIKVSKVGDVLMDIPLNLAFTDTDGEICFVTTDVNNTERIHLWVIFNKGKYVIVLDENGRVFKRIDLTTLFIGRYCSTFQLNIVGDFTGFDNKRKFEQLEQLSGNVISPRNPAFTARLGLLCGEDRRIVRIHSTTDYADGWTHFAFTLENTKDLTTVRFYVNGREAGSKTLNGNYKIDYGYKSFPFIIGGNSGKLGAKNIEKSIIQSGFFTGEIDNIRLYNKSLSDFEVLNLSLQDHYSKWTDLSFYIKTPPITMIEEINTFHINRYKGFKSNYFNINIKNFTDNVDLQELVKDYIYDNISLFIPANTILNEIKFE